MRAVVLRAIGEVRVDAVPEPEPGAGGAPRAGEEPTPAGEELTPASEEWSPTARPARLKRRRARYRSSGSGGRRWRPARLG